MSPTWYLQTSLLDGPETENSIWSSYHSFHKGYRVTALNVGGSHCFWSHNISTHMLDGGAIYVQCPVEGRQSWSRKVSKIEASHVPRVSVLIVHKIVCGWPSTMELLWESIYGYHMRPRYNFAISPFPAPSATTAYTAREKQRQLPL